MNGQKNILPSAISKLFWDADFRLIDPKKHKESIITRILNYGRLKDWRWIISYYGLTEIKQVLEALRSNSLRPPVRRLTSLLIG